MPPFEEEVFNAQGEDMGRILALSDAIFAVAITLLVLGVAIPEIKGLSGVQLNQELARTLYESMGAIGSYVLSFIVISVYWNAHHRIFQYIKRYDTTLVRLNMLLLLLVTFLPVPTGVIGRYGETPVAVLFYATSIILIGLLMVAIWSYATHRHRLVERDLQQRVITYYRTRFLLVPVVFLLSLPLIFVTLFEPTFSGPNVTEFSWLLTVVAFIVHKRLYRKQSMAQPQPVQQKTLDQTAV